jgi:hypothetical protein
MRLSFSKRTMGRFIVGNGLKLILSGRHSCVALSADGGIASFSVSRYFNLSDDICNCLRNILWSNFKGSIVDLIVGFDDS